MPLTDDQLIRYSRHIVLPEVGVEGQEKLLKARVLCVGVGGLGSPVALYLSAAGVGTLGLVDFDRVNFSDLQRQIIHSSGSVGQSKLKSARERIASVNPEVQVQLHETKLSRENALEIIGKYDIVVDGTDNFPTRYLINDACFFLKKPFVYGGLFRFDGQASVFKTPGGPCYRCLFPEAPPPGMAPSCAEGGVLGVLPGMIGTIQAAEAIKLILGKGDILLGRLLVLNAMEMKFREVSFEKDNECPLCGRHPTIKDLPDEELFCAGNGSSTHPHEEVTVLELKRILESNERKIFLLDVRETEEYRISHLSGAKLIPLGNLAERAGELDREGEIFVYCKGGSRGMNAVGFLKKLGFKKVKNVKGGITAWIREVDPSLPQQ